MSFVQALRIRSVSRTVVASCKPLFQISLSRLSQVQALRSSLAHLSGPFGSCAPFHSSSRSSASTGASLPQVQLPYSYVHGASSVPLVNIPLGRQLERTTADLPDRTAFVFTKQGRRHTYRSFNQEVDKLAAAMLKMGIQPGERVAVWGPNTPEWLITQFAAHKVGAILVMLNPTFKAGEIQGALNKTEASLLVTPPRWRALDYMGMLRGLAPEIEAQLTRRSPASRLTLQSLPHLRSLLLFGDEAARLSPASISGAYKWEQIPSLATAEMLEKLRQVEKRIMPDDPAIILFTSGTTGLPKCTVLSHHSLVNNALGMARRMEIEKPPMSPHPILNVPLPIFHSAALSAVNLMNAVGMTIVIPDESFNPEETLISVGKEKCNMICGSAATFLYLLRHPQLDKFDLSTLYAGVVGAGPCPAPILQQIATRLHTPHVVMAYGLTETAPMCFVGAPSDTLENRTGTAGKIFDHQECKIVDGEGRIVPLGQPGEVCMRGYNIMLEYWNDPQATKEALGADRFYHTGDLGILDQRGYLRIVGRIKDIIIRGGENINPLEIEQILRQHPAIQDAQVIGVPSQQFGQEVCACIILKPVQGKEAPPKPTPLEIRKFVSDRVAGYKSPRYALFLDAFPMTATAKVQKFKLIEMAIQQLQLKAMTDSNAPSA